MKNVDWLMVTTAQRRLFLALLTLAGSAALSMAQVSPVPGEARQTVEQGSAGKLAAAVDAHYNDLKSMQAEFSESYRGAGASRTEAGTLWLKRPGKMRWEYRDPRPKLFVSDGKTAWFYVPGEPQAQRAPVNKVDDLRSPLRFLLGKAKLSKELRNLQIQPGAQAGNVVLSGLPKGMEDRISRVLLEVTPQYQIVRLVLEEVDGASTEFRFSQEKENIAVADQQFRFSPPEGVGVVEATELGE